MKHKENNQNISKIVSYLENFNINIVENVKSLRLFIFESTFMYSRFSVMLFKHFFLIVLKIFIHFLNVLSTKIHLKVEDFFLNNIHHCKTNTFIVPLRSKMHTELDY